ncbi:transmembrane protease serine 9-like [Drosophila tropicalis]|uniref:transmembrane protease serine 9-like n=1 Tax=Drosophila tropicalis TaxID=46794 RepID=UPI0035ABFC8F
MVALVVNGNQTCGGALVSNTMVLTAAHCVAGRDITTMNIVLGTNDLTDPERQTFDVNNIIIHQNFNFTAYDIAFLRLHREVELDDDVQLIKLAPRNENYPEKTLAITSGFGGISIKEDRQRILKYAYIKVLGSRYCDGYLSFIKDHMICAGDLRGEQGPCKGDAGDPLIVGGVLIGVASQLFDCTAPYRPVAYTSVTKLRGFIDDSLNRYFVPVLGLLLALSGSGFLFADAIIAGRIVEKQQLSYMVALLVNGNQQCGGVLVSKIMVLTAAACVMGRNVTELKVVAGTNDLIKSLVPVLALLFALSSDGFFFANAILCGRFAREGQFPHQVAVIYDDKQECGGSVVTKYMILTAAHCVAGENLKLLKIVVGTSDLNSGYGQIFYVQKVIVHPNFRFNTKDYDIALLRLTKPLTFGKNIRSIRLAPAGENYLENLTAIVSGFGDINSRGDRLSRMKYALIQLWGRRYCNSVNIPQLTDRMICAGDPLGQEGPLSVKSFVAAFGLLLVLACHAFYFADAIIGGQFARPGQFPYQGSLLIDGFNRCGCSVISKTTVLTTGHCIVGRNTSSLKVLLGTIDTSAGDGQTLDVKEIIIHPNFNVVTRDYDVGLLWLSTAAHFSDKIRSIRLAPAGDNYLENLTAITTGFGEIDRNRNRLSRMKYALIQLWGRRYCNSANIPQLTDRMICAGDPLGRQGPCRGDSGGPLTLHGLQIAIASWGFGCGAPYYPSIFTYVPIVREWIDANING